MELSNRLQHIADFVTPGSRLADIGTDHALIPVHLVLEGRIPSALAMDLRKGPLKRAADRIRALGLEEKIETRLSDGLDGLREGEADTILMAGMGGNLMRELLQRGSRCREWVREYVFSPQSAWLELRCFLRQEGYEITKEDMVREDGKYYLIIRALPFRIRKGAPFLEYKKRQMYDRFGEALIKGRHPILLSYLKREEEINLRNLEHIKTAKDFWGAEKRRRELLEYLVQLREAKNEMYETPGNP